MITRDKMFVVAGNVDDSIKSVTPIYDITIFPNFVLLEQFIEKTPIVLGSIVVSEKELSFTASNMSRLLEVLTAPFLKMTGNCIYLIDEGTSKDVVQSFLTENDITTIVCYQGDLSTRFISDIVSGAARIADESETEVITYRMRASEYITEQSIKRYESDSDHYKSDEELLREVPDIEEPEPTIPTIDVLTSTYYVVGKQSLERSLFTFVEAQYLSLTGKTFIIESDKNYHRLTDMVLKSQADFEYYDIEDFNTNCSDVLGKIKNSGSRLIVMGCKNRIDYDYDFLFDLLMNNLEGYIDYFIKECDFVQTPYGSYYNIVCCDTVSDILECVQSLRYDVDESKVVMIGLRTRNMGEINVTSSEMTDMVQLLLGKNNLHAEVITASGINLKGDEVTYDVFGVITRGNERQG